MDQTKLELNTKQGAMQGSQRSAGVVPLAGIFVPKPPSRDASITLTTL